MRSLTLALALATSALASDVLVPGNPPLTTAMVQNVTSVFEWLAGVNLGSPQRAAVEQMLLESWRHGNSTQVAQWVQLSSLRPQLDALDANQRQAVRRALVAQMQKDGNPFANLVSSAPVQPPATSTNHSPVLGKWEQRSGSSSITYQNTVTGSFSAPTGNINAYTFTPDGQYQYAELHQVSTYGCTTKYFGFERGPYSVNGNRITFTQREHSLEFTSTCNSSLNSNKNLPLNTESYSFEIVQGQYGQEMVLTDGKSRWRFNRAQ